MIFRTARFQRAQSHERMSAFRFVILSAAKDLIAGSTDGGVEAAMRSFAYAQDDKN